MSRCIAVSLRWSSRYTEQGFKIHVLTREPWTHIMPWVCRMSWQNIEQLFEVQVSQREYPLQHLKLLWYDDEHCHKKRFVAGAVVAAPNCNGRKLDSMYMRPMNAWDTLAHIIRVSSKSTLQWMSLTDSPVSLDIHVRIICCRIIAGRLRAGAARAASSESLIAVQVCILEADRLVIRRWRKDNHSLVSFISRLMSVTLLGMNFIALSKMQLMIDVFSPTI